MSQEPKREPFHGPITCKDEALMVLVDYGFADVSWRKDSTQPQPVAGLTTLADNLLKASGQHAWDGCQPFHATLHQVLPFEKNYNPWERSLSVSRGPRHVKVSDLRRAEPTISHPPRGEHQGPPYTLKGYAAVSEFTKTLLEGFVSDKGVQRQETIRNLSLMLMRCAHGDDMTNEALNATLEVRIICRNDDNPRQFNPLRSGYKVQCGGRVAVLDDVEHINPDGTRGTITVQAPDRSNAELAR